MKFTLETIIFALVAGQAMATHKLGSNCSGKDINTYGCSKDECSVIKCVSKGNGKYYWQYEESCIGIKCENGACNSAYVKDSCSA